MDSGSGSVDIRNRFQFRHDINDEQMGALYSERGESKRFHSSRDRISSHLRRKPTTA